MKKIITLFIFIILQNNAFANLINLEFNNGDSLSDWSVDRAAPASFSVVNNELQMVIDGSTEGNTDNFHDTRGMNMTISQSNYLSIDMFVDENWTNTGERYGGLWVVGYSSYFDSNGWGSNTYPILEYQVDDNGVGGIAQWDSWYGWNSSLSNLFQVNEFNNLKFIIGTAGVEYYINNQLIYVDTMTKTEYFSKVILNAKNEGSNFTVRYDNLTYGNIAVPEPSTLVIFALGLMGLVSRRKV